MERSRDTADGQSPAAGGVVLSPSARPTVAVILVNYCSARLTIDCLRSLEGEVRELPGTSVIVSDNASPDGSGAAIAEAIAERGWSSWARVLPLPRNGGYSYGNNSAFRDLLSTGPLPRYVWLLNTDTIVRPRALRSLVDFMEATPRAGVAGSRLEALKGSPHCSAFRFHSVAGEFEASVGWGIVSKLLAQWSVATHPVRDPVECDWVSGASFFVRSEIFRDLGLMDEGFFLYFEDTDFCRRANERGTSCWYVPQSRVVHLEGQTTGVTNPNSRTRRRAGYWFEARRRYFVKHHGVAYAAMADVALATGMALSRLRDRLLRRPARHPEKFLRDLACHSPLIKRNLDTA
jgi:N-acetylglucosaminyl-diphospho-decaprenol L-rhamnosyltransferase